MIGLVTVVVQTLVKGSEGAFKAVFALGSLSVHVSTSMFFKSR